MEGLVLMSNEVDDLEDAVNELKLKGIMTESVRIDEYTGKKFVFFEDPDGLPLELYEV
jgi:glyoxylase I family protein